MLFILPIAIVGYAVIANVHDPHVKYGMTFLMATGMYASVPCILVWNSNNSAGHYKRATTSAMQLAIANCGGFVASKLLTRSEIFCGKLIDRPWQHLIIPLETHHNITAAILLFLAYWYFRGLCTKAGEPFDHHVADHLLTGSCSTFCTALKSTGTKRGASTPNIRDTMTIEIPRLLWCSEYEAVEMHEVFILVYQSFSKDTEPIVYNAGDRAHDFRLLQQLKTP